MGGVILNLFTMYFSSMKCNLHAGIFFVWLGKHTKTQYTITEHTTQYIARLFVLFYKLTK
jgi:hypothetical protein